MKQKPSVHEYLMFAEAWGLLALSRILILFVSFRRILPVIGKPVDETQAQEIIAHPVATPADLKAIALAIARACPRSPWRTMCFEQALTARMMLHRRGKKSVIYFGIRKQQEDGQKAKLTAHAWIICSGTVVTGGIDNNVYTVAGRFTA